MNKARIYYHDIGDYLSREEKLAIISKFGSIENIEWQELSPNEHGDWLNQRNDAFEGFIPLAPEKKFSAMTNSVFIGYSLGLCTNRDAFCYNSSSAELSQNIQMSLEFYNSQRLNYHTALEKGPKVKITDVICYDSAKLSWTDTVLRDAQNNIDYQFEENSIAEGLYRPFFRQKIYYKKELNHRQYQIPKLFPYSGVENKVICISGVGASKDFSTLITDSIPNLDSIEKAQCFPMYHYEERKVENKTLFDDAEDTVHNNYVRRDAISDFMLERCRKAYGSRVSKEDIFYYVYGILHSVEYRTAFAADLKKMLPRIPLVDEARDFYAFSKAGRALAELHLGYEGLEDRVLGAGVTVQCMEESNTLSPEPYTLYAVEKMRFPSKSDKSKILYNHQITIENIPAEAYDYVVNGKSAIEWIMERYAITTHKDSGITNNPNLWATEHNNPRYILDLLLSVIRLSVESVEIIRNLPKIT